MMNKKSKIITYIIVLLLVIMAIGFIGYFTNWFSSDFSTFYIVYNDERLLRNVDELHVLCDKELVFDVKSSFGGSVEYKVSILPATDFEYTVDDKAYSFMAQDYSDCFSLKKSEESFSIVFNSDMKAILAKKHNGNIVIDDDIKMTDKVYFNLVITVEKKSITLGLMQYYGIESVDFDNTEIIFND